jgi:hypothetical protein
MRPKAEAIAAPREEPCLLSEADIARLPLPVRRYIALTGAIGRPVVTEVTLRFEARMYDAPRAPGMTGPVAQYERFDLPRRLFLMTTRMKGLPVAVLHDFDRDQATMRVRLAGLINVVLQHRPTSASGSAARQNGVTSTGRFGPFVSIEEHRRR